MRKGPPGNMAHLIQQASQMKKKMEAIQEEVGKRTIEAAAGGGAVRAVVNGKQELVDLVIAKEAMEGADAEMLQDMVKAAVNEALKKSQEMSNNAMNGVLGGMPLPPGLF